MKTVSTLVATVIVALALTVSGSAGQRVASSGSGSQWKWTSMIMARIQGLNEL
jgi:hypothetical protein